MLIRYKRNFEKIAMGLLSFMPEGKDVKKLQELIEKYEEDSDWHLYLWRQEEDIIGVIGIKIDSEINAVIQHIGVTPSHRDAGVGKKMVQSIKDMYEDKYAVCPDERTLAFYNKSVEEQ